MIKDLFNSVEEMNKGLIANWNSVVKNKKDKVYVLGDFSFGNKYQAKKILNSLKGNKNINNG